MISLQCLSINPICWSSSVISHKCFRFDRLWCSDVTGLLFLSSPSQPWASLERRINKTQNGEEIKISFGSGLESMILIMADKALSGFNLISQQTLIKRDLSCALGLDNADWQTDCFKSSDQHHGVLEVTFTPLMHLQLLRASVGLMYSTGLTCNAFMIIYRATCFDLVSCSLFYNE